MIITRLLVPVILFGLAAPASLPAATVPARCLIVGSWTMSAKEAPFSFVHHLEFKSDGGMTADDETIIDEKKIENHCQGTFWFEGKTLVIVSWGENQPHRVERVSCQVSSKHLEIIYHYKKTVFQRVK